MAEYIERGFVLDVVKRTSGDYACAFSEIAHAPAADVAQVVRCRECQHVVAEAMFPGGLICRLTSSVVIPDGFCYRGKLQTNEEKEG